MTRLSLFTFLTLLAFACCDEDHMDDPMVENYFPMEVGNYWIYQYNQERADGTFELQSITDSTVITGTELIGDKTYYKFENIRLPNSISFTYYRRDSLGYMVDEKGTIFYTPNDNDGILQIVEKEQNSIPDAITTTYSQENEKEDITVPAGTFATKRLIAEIEVSPDFLPNYNCDKDNVTYYAPEVGKVRDDQHYSGNCLSLFKELVRFNLK